MNSIITRTFEDAFLGIKKNTWDTIFFEGGSSKVAQHFVVDANYEPTLSDFPEYGEESWNDIREDCRNIKIEIDLFLAGKSKTLPVDSTSTNSDDVSPLQRLSQYATSHWQLTVANIELTSQCNFRCGFCYLADYNNGGLSLLELEKLGIGLQKAGVVFTSLTGGEMFMRPDVAEIIALYSQLGFALEIKTNGALLNANRISLLEGLPIFDFQISIYEISDGISEITHSHYPFDRIADNIRQLVEMGLPVGLSVIVGKHNIDVLDVIHQTLKKIADISIFYNPLITPRRSGADEGIAFRLSAEELNGKFLPFLRRNNDFVREEKHRDCSTCINPCFAGRNQIAIDPSGNVYPCLDLPEIIGNIRYGDVDNILSIESRRKAMDKFLIADMAQCLTCEIKDCCDSCVGIALVENGDHTRPARHKCDVARFYALNDS